MAEVRVGQVWASNDWRDRKRVPQPTCLVHVIVHYGDPAKSYATVKWDSGRLSRILLRRFRPNSTGYYLVSEPKPVPTPDQPTRQED